MWNGWAEQRTDVWRSAMGAAVPPAPGSSNASAYAVVPPGIANGRDFAFIVIGDTHDLESYLERYDAPSAPRTMHHMVNGGGGAYLSFGTALAWPKNPATATWAFYPSRDQVVQKIDAMAQAWERPVWWWTRRFNAWPFSAEWLSAAFDFNAAPFFQSFVEVRVEPSMGRVRLLPWGVHGRLR
jgi:hypothetical protein